MFLKNRSAVIRYNIRQLKFEGATTLYIRCLCTVFFSSLSDTAKEFLKAFPDHYGCYSGEREGERERERERESRRERGGREGERGERDLNLLHNDEDIGMYDREI